MSGKHVMIDIEAFGNKSPAFIASIGAIAFDPESDQIGDSYYQVINDEGNGAMEWRTVQWWLAQNRDAQLALAQPVTTQPLRQALVDLMKQYPNHTPWAKGANYDLTHLSEAARRLDVWWGWGFRWHCTRSLSFAAKAAGWAYQGVNLSGTAHNALDDAIRQARQVQSMVKYLKGNRS